MNKDAIICFVRFVIIVCMIPTVVTAGNVKRYNVPVKAPIDFVERFTRDGIEYGLTDEDEIWILNYNISEKTDAYLPDELLIDGRACPVVGIRNRAFTQKTMKTLSLPRHLKDATGSFYYSSADKVLVNSSISTNFAEYTKSTLKTDTLVIGEDVADLGSNFMNNEIKHLIFNAKELTGNYLIGAQDMRGIVIGNQVCYLPQSFACYSQISNVIIPESVEVIGGGAFEGCDRLASITLPSGLQRIGNMALQGFKGTLFLMNGLTAIDDIGASPSAIFSLSNVPQQASKLTFIGSKEGVVVHIPPTANIADYFEAPYWDGFTYRADAVRPETFSIPAEHRALINTSFTMTSSLGTSSGDQPVAWASTDPTVATVDRTGKVTALSLGETDLVATCYDHVAVCHLTVIDNVLKITPATITLEEGRSAALTVTCGQPLDGVDLQWSSDDRTVAAVAGNGTTATVLGIDRGMTTIRVKSASGDLVEATCQVQVQWRPKNSYGRGDVNGDGVVDVQDVSDQIDVILGKTLPDDLRGDCAMRLPRNTVDINDLNLLINIVLGRINPDDPQSLGVETQTIAVNGVQFKMVKVEGGAFVMGATDEQLPFINIYNTDERPAHEVVLSDYWIGETEVSQELWEAVMGENPAPVTGPRLPVYNVSRTECLEFIKRLNELTGMTFALPTEAQWEYAARGGIWSRGFVYAGGNDPDMVAWYKANSDGQMHPVAGKVPNELGLYDMSGNVTEWCMDWCSGLFYSMSPKNDPVLTHYIDDDPTALGYSCRGASANSDSWYLRVSARDGRQYIERENLGMRLARSK